MLTYGPVDTTDLQPVHHEILDCLRGGRCTPSRLAHELDLPQHRVTRRLRELRAAEYVEKLHPDLFELADDPRRLPSDLPWILRGWVKAENPHHEAVERARNALATIDDRWMSDTDTQNARWAFMTWFHERRQDVDEDEDNLPTDAEVEAVLSTLTRGNRPPNRMSQTDLSGSR